MKYKFIGYGSLLSHKSLKETIKDKKFLPVIVKGYKRIFNLRDNSKYDVLNLKKDKRYYFNGVVFEINEKELQKLKKREDDYNLEEVKYYDFYTKKKLGKALVVIDYLVGIDKDGKPKEEYLEMCRSAAYKIGDDFGKVWDKTTYTSNGKKIKDLMS